MATLVYFTRAVEDDQVVRYNFGPGRDLMNRVLVIDKATWEATPEDGLGNREFLAASRTILGLRRDRTRWPETGMHAG